MVYSQKLDSMIKALTKHCTGTVPVPEGWTATRRDGKTFLRREGYDGEIQAYTARDGESIVVQWHRLHEANRVVIYAACVYGSGELCDRFRTCARLHDVEVPCRCVVPARSCDCGYGGHPGIYVYVDEEGATTKLAAEWLRQMGAEALVEKLKT